jgi:Aspartyl protease
MVNGRQSSFVLDTGCPITYINLEQANSLGVKVLKTATRPAAGTGNNTVLAYQTKPLILKSGSTVLTKKAMLAISMGDVTKALDREIGGALCYDLLQTSPFVIDIPNRKIELDAVRQGVSAVTPQAELIETHSGLPLVHMSVIVADRKISSASVLLDTGSQRELVINRTMAQENRLFEMEGWKKSQGVGLGGLHGVLHGYSGSIFNESIELLIRDVFLSTAETGNTTGNQPDDAFLGCGSLGKYALFFDTPNKRVFFLEGIESTRQ